MDRRHDDHHSRRYGDNVEEGEWSRDPRAGRDSYHYDAAPPVRGEDSSSHSRWDYSQSDRQRDGDQSSRRDHHDDHYNDAAPEEQQRRLPPANTLRLVKLTSDVLPEEQKIAVIDGRNDGVSIGRDRCFTARIRCPSMEVSKHHANIFKMSNASNDRGRRSKDIFFAVADTGSTHGTYVLLDCPSTMSLDTLPPNTAYERLSPQKKASIPKCLRHLSLLRIGKTVFQAHLHPGWSTVCEDCDLDGTKSNEILLHERREANPAPAHQAVAVTAKTKMAPQQALKELKSRHLGEEVAAPSEVSQLNYVDRAAARRARGGVPASSAPATNAIPAKSATVAPSAPVVSRPAAKLDATNRGYQMFSSMSGKSGRMNAISHDPILARGVEGRAGLGSKRLLDVQEMGSRPSGYSPESVRERQRRRFEESRQ